MIHLKLLFEGNKNFSHIATINVWEKMKINKVQYFTELGHIKITYYQFLVNNLLICNEQKEKGYQNKSFVFFSHIGSSKKNV